MEHPGFEPETSDFFFSHVLTTAINERLIRKFNYTNVHVNIWTVDGGWCPTFWFFKSLDNNSIYTLDIQLYICSRSRYLDGKEKPKKMKEKQITKEKKRQENQKNEVIRRKGKDKKRKRKYKRKSASCC